MRRILFLDIDGVMWGWKTSRNAWPEKQKIDLLNTLLPYNVEVVLTSTWNEDGKKTLEKMGLELPIIDITEKLSPNWCCRGNEIEKWLVKTFGFGSKFGNEFENSNVKFVIVDDEDDILFGQRNFFVHVDGNQGISEEDFRKIKKLLV